MALERISCSSSTGKIKDANDFIRVVVNGAVQVLPDCNEGPGGSCGSQEFGEFVKERVERWKDFEGACGVGEGK